MKELGYVKEMYLCVNMTIKVSFFSAWCVLSFTDSLEKILHHF